MTAATAAPQIKVERDGWGSASAADIRTVLESVFSVMVIDFPEHSSDRIVVSRSRSGPSVQAETTADPAYHVQLDVDDTRWDQFAYQFSHELCHIFSNFEHREISPAAPRSHQWFEEAACEAMSLLGLERVAARWESASPHQHWRSYASAFRDYKARLLAQPHRRVASLPSWYQANRDELDADPYRRAESDVVATALFTLIREVPADVAALGYLNLAPAEGDFRQFLESWRDSAPLRCRTFIAKVISLLEV